eukprot:6950879-Pyramimonas_sp.AAC.1
MLEAELRAPRLFDMDGTLVTTTRALGDHCPLRLLDCGGLDIWEVPDGQPGALVAVSCEVAAPIHRRLGD